MKVSRRAVRIDDAAIAEGANRYGQQVDHLAISCLAFAQRDFGSLALGHVVIDADDMTLVSLAPRDRQRMAVGGRYFVHTVAAGVKLVRGRNPGRSVGGGRRYAPRCL